MIRCVNASVDRMLEPLTTEKQQDKKQMQGLSARILSKREGRGQGFVVQKKNFYKCITTNP